MDIEDREKDVDMEEVKKYVPGKLLLNSMQSSKNSKRNLQKSTKMIKAISKCLLF